MLAIHLAGPQNTYHMRLLGLSKTVERHRLGFEGWLKAFN
jgi:hypothetical protein